MYENPEQAKSDRKLVILAEKIHPQPHKWLSERVNLVECSQDNNNNEQFDRYLQEAHGLVVRTYTIVDQTLLEKSPNLKVVGRAGVGVDNIDLEACRKHGVTVVNTPNANTQAVIEFVMGNILDAVHPRKFIHNAYNLENWQNIRHKHVIKAQLNEITLGIYGLGRIGKRLAEVAAPFGSRIIYHDLLDIPQQLSHRAQPVDVDTLIAESDVLTIHVDGRPANTNLINTETFAKMKPDVRFINTSRGFVVNILDLARFLKANPQAQAWIDVHAPEPFSDEYPLLGLPNVHISPHLAGKTEAAVKNMSDVVYDIWAVLSGTKPKYAIL